MIKGRYVAQVEVDFQCEESQTEISTKELSDRMYNGWMAEAMGKTVAKIFKNANGSVKVSQQYADLVEVKGEADEQTKN